MREIIANADAEGVREVKAKCVSLPQNAGDLKGTNLCFRLMANNFEPLSGSPPGKGGHYDHPKLAKKVFGIDLMGSGCEISI